MFQQPAFIRQGAMTMIAFATVGLASNVLFPLVVTSKAAASAARRNETTPAFLAQEKAQTQLGIPTLLQWSMPTFRVKIRWLTLPRAWALSQLFMSLILITTIFTHSSSILTIQVSLLGVSWAMTQWAPLALISAQIANYKSDHAGVTEQSTIAACRFGCDGCSTSTNLSSSEGGESEKDGGLEGGNHITQPELRAGVVMAIYNVSIATPQILAALGCSSMFWILGRFGLNDGEAVGWVIRLGGVSSLAAAWLILRSQEEQDLEMCHRLDEEEDSEKVGTIGI